MSLSMATGGGCINPSPEDIHAFRRRIRKEQAISSRIEALRQLPAQTLDRASIPLHANLGIGDEDLSMLAKEYEGAVLYRTEFFFIAREALPAEDDQYRLYRDLLESFSPKPVTIRTLDDGGDKKLPFFSIGTNDLAQYLLAVDRSNPQVRGLNDNLHPAVVHVVNDIVQRSRRRCKPVGVYREMAGDPASAILLLGLGVDSLSMNPPSLPRVKWTLRSLTMKQGRELAEKALNIENEFDTLRLLNHALKATFHSRRENSVRPRSSSWTF